MATWFIVTLLLLIELSSPSVNSVVYVKADLRLMNLAFNPKF